MIIRDEIAGDPDAIGRVTESAFAGTAHASGNEAAIVEALRDGGALTLSLVAEEHGEIIGHVAFSPVTMDGTDLGWFGLGPVSVRPDRQRAGIGKKLIGEGLSRLRDLGAAGCVVLGNPAYYGRFGFACDPSLEYGDAPAEYFQALSFGGAIPTGKVVYHRGFEAVR